MTLFPKNITMQTTARSVGGVEGFRVVGCKMGSVFDRVYCHVNKSETSMFGISLSILNYCVPMKQ